MLYIESSAQDLVLLGVVPIVGLAVLADALFKLSIKLLQTTPQTMATAS